MTYHYLVRIGIVLTVLVATWIAASLPPEYTHDTNGCGAWGTGWLFPEFWFTSACNQHDICFRSGADKHACNVAFYDDMKVICAAKAGLVRRACFALAFVGFWGVEVAN